MQIRPIFGLLFQTKRIYNVYRKIKISNYSEDKLMKNKTKKQEIENYIYNLISSGQLKENDRLLTEEELCEMFEVSRMTAHNAMSDLVARGLITRTAGKGSFVAGKSVLKGFERKQSFTEDMISVGMKAGSKLLTFKQTVAAEYPIAIKALELSDDDEIYYFERLRTGDDQPIALQYTYIPVRIIPDFDVSALSGSLDLYLQEKGITLGEYETRLAAVVSTSEQQRLLDIPKNHPLLRSCSFRYTANKIPYEYTETFYRSDKYEYSFATKNRTIAQNLTY